MDGSVNTDVVLSDSNIHLNTVWTEGINVWIIDKIDTEQVDDA